MSERDGYRGYSNESEQPDYGTGVRRYRMKLLGAPDETLEVPPRNYFALGDNSFHSSDSRDWGGVPEENVMGRGVFVYWPFTRHWGRIR
jgi:signal peptidase I